MTDKICCFHILIALLPVLSGCGTATGVYPDLDRRLDQVTQEIAQVKADERNLDETVTARLSGIEEVVVRTVSKALTDARETRTLAEEARKETVAARAEVSTVQRDLLGELTALKAQLDTLARQPAEPEQITGRNDSGAAGQPYYLATESMMRLSELFLVTGRAASMPDQATAGPAALTAETIITNFGASEWGLGQTGSSRLDQFHTRIKQTGYRLLTIIGHADPSGKDDNYRLSWQRAESVKKYLLAKGVAEERIIAIGLGDAVAIASNATADGRKQNRRVSVRAWSWPAENAPQTASSDR